MQAIKREDMKEGDGVCFVGTHILTWERYKRDYGIPDWEYAFYNDNEKQEQVELRGYGDD